MKTPKIANAGFWLGGASNCTSNSMQFFRQLKKLFVLQLHENFELCTTKFSKVKVCKAINKWSRVIMTPKSNWISKIPTNHVSCKDNLRKKTEKKRIGRTDISKNTKNF